MTRYRELKAQLDELNQQIDRLREREAHAALEQIRELVEFFDFSSADVFGTTKQESPYVSRPKYRDPDTGRTWSGRGPRPYWLKDKNLEAYRIDG